MKTYISAAIVKAKSMTLGEYKEFLNKQIKDAGFGDAENNPCDIQGYKLSPAFLRGGDSNSEGYVIIYPDKDGNFDGAFTNGGHFLSWCPLEIFVVMYRQIKV